MSAEIGAALCGLFGFVAFYALKDVALAVAAYSVGVLFFLAILRSRGKDH
jgi:hypothetical protein